MQPAHIAAQYGHTSALYHLVLRWNCDFNSLDNENRTPLHWAAYKGFHDLVRLLLVLGCDPSAQDTEGCNSLHWASIRGNSEAATILIQVLIPRSLPAADFLSRAWHHGLVILSKMLHAVTQWFAGCHPLLLCCAW